jgi:hypothetical protein
MPHLLTSRLQHELVMFGNFEAYDEKLFSSNFLRLMDLGEDEEMTDLPDKTTTH